MVVTKYHTYLNKPTPSGCIFVLSTHDLLLPPDIKGLMQHYSHPELSLNSMKSGLRFCTVANSVCGMLEICDGENLRQQFRLEIRINTFCRLTIGLQGAQLSGQRLSLRNQRFPARATLLAMRRDEPPAAIVQPMPKSVRRVETVERN